MDEIGCVNIFLAEGAGIDDIVADLEAAGERSGATRSATSRSTPSTPAATSPTASPQAIGAEKKMVQKSGYFSRSAPANDTDLALIREMAELAVASRARGHGRE